MKKYNRVRNCNFTMRLRDYQYALLCAKKDEADMTISDYIRTLILFAPACERPRFSSEYAEQIREQLNIIGNSVNEIAHASNAIKAVTPRNIELLSENFIKLSAIYDEYVSDYTKNPY